MMDCAEKFLGLPMPLVSKGLSSVRPGPLHLQECAQLLNLLRQQHLVLGRGAVISSGACSGNVRLRSSSVLFTVCTLLLNCAI